MKKILVVLLIVAIVGCSSVFAYTLTGENNRVTAERELADGVKYTQIKAGKNYNNVQFDLIEVDLSKEGIVFDNVYGSPFITHAWKRTSDMIKEFNGTDGKKALAAINAELWTVTYAHSRVLGSETSYGGYNDPVVKKGLALPRGYNVIDGEIVSTSHMQQETPFEGDFWSFGITEDNIPILSNPTATVNITNLTKNTNAKADGINRLPANNALVMYTDKGCANNYALDDAFEVVIDITSTPDYVIKHGTDITGKVIAIYGPEDKDNPVMEANSNKIILTARGSRVSKISDYQIGDEINIKVDVRDKNGRFTEEWRRAKVATGGHIPFVVNGRFQNVSPGGSYPTAFIGITSEGKIIMGTYGSSKHDGGRVGIASYKDLVKDLDLVDAFIFDGGGSATTVVLDENEYKVVNNPSDTGGAERQVLNCLVVSYVEPKPEPTDEVGDNDENGDENNGENNGGNTKDEKHDKGIDSNTIIIIISSVAIVAGLVTIVLVLRKKK
ncbi:MAG: phosphodiester glycosidase family protein [Clostridiaceae bacterium]|nr:phosphodiester glycosidase family protein [Clostridiaceae bacterium]